MVETERTSGPIAWIHIAGTFEKGESDDGKNVLFFYIFFLGFRHVKFKKRSPSLYVGVDTRITPFPCELKREGADDSRNSAVSHDFVTCTAKEIAPDLSSTSKQTKHISKYLKPSRLGSQVPRNIRSGLSVINWHTIEDINHALAPPGAVRPSTAAVDLNSGPIDIGAADTTVYDLHLQNQQLLH